MKRNWFLYFFRKSISQRKGRVAIALIAVMLAVAIVTGLIGITSGIKDKLGSELKAYGANLIVSSRAGIDLDYESLDVISKLDGVEYVSGYVFGTALINKESVEITGLDMDRMKEIGWRVTGNWPKSENEILAGSNLKEALELETGKTVVLLNENGNNPPIPPLEKGGKGGFDSVEKDELIGKKRKMDFTVSGFIERGGNEDNAFIISLTQAWELMGIDNKLNVILVRGKSGVLKNIVSNIKNIVPGINVKTMRQVAVAEESLLRKMQLLLILVTIVVLFAATVSIMSTMGANVLERREEIGLMKAIGATRNNIRSFYFAEAVLIGLAGGIAGFILGYLFTQAVSWGAFDSFISVPSYLSLVSVAAGLIISLIASHFPVSNSLKYNPAVILREE